jgi:hypothetical protein
VVAVPGGRGRGKVTTAALACYRPGHRSRLIWRQHVWRRRKGEAKSFSWRDYRDLLTAAHHQLPGGKIVLITVIRRGLKRLQYRPEVIDGCLAATGLTITAITS